MSLRFAGPVRLLFVAVSVASAACGSAPADTANLRVVAAFYPLAWAARAVGGAGVAVQDLTPRGAEAHDLQLSARQRGDVARASIVLVLGNGFQPELERAARDATGKVVDLSAGLWLLPAHEQGMSADPHVWQDPVLMRQVVSSVAAAFAAADPGHRLTYEANAAAAQRRLGDLDAAYRGGLGGCTLRLVVTTHQAFGYLAARYGLTELGLTGLTPEAEPGAAKIQHVRGAAARGEVRAVFYEASDEGRRIGQSVARDVGVPALALNTLESDPAPADYVSQMTENLSSLRKGLACP